MEWEKVISAKLIRERLITSAQAAAPRKLSKHSSLYTAPLLTPGSEVLRLRNPITQFPACVFSWHCCQVGHDYQVQCFNAETKSFACLSDRQVSVLKRADQCKCFILPGKEAQTRVPTLLPLLPKELYVPLSWERLRSGSGSLKPSAMCPVTSFIESSLLVS